ncbi:MULTISPECIES: hypothetical protein [unclassified Paenibacillus]|uniref:hypothetical protein n=1 Tax=unclassified Paenibacillus TaxID=185978 RepID=UPI00020D708D|nr:MULTISPECIES: hypothetical protein [unclassified Paenibacillus]EGL18183.1 hypothetical protein HMPREF9413_5985 [Paenibacillus sp. HGF7]EPD88101.1 hypothetical protein HMPREF1207_02643 [Paenibacillus sp. HGH0039]
MNYTELRSLVIEEKDKILFDEAISCLKGNALRAAYITAWICVAESLKSKFYKMATRDHEVARKVISQLEKREESERPTDTALINYADDYGLITKDQKRKLEHIKTMRGIYAHPLNNAPTISEVEFALETGVISVLSKPALLKHAFVQDLCTQIFENYHFLDDEMTKVERHATSTLKHINPIVYPYFFKKLVQGLNQSVNDYTKEVFYRRGMVFARTLLKEVGTQLAEREWAIPELLRNQTGIISKIFVDEEFWPKISEETQDSILGYELEPINNGEPTTPSVESIEYFKILFDKELLTERQLERFKLAVNRSTLKQRVQSEIPLQWYMQDFIEDLKSRNWYVQNDVIEAVILLGPEKLSVANNDFLIQLGRNFLQAADGGARTAEEFIKSLYKESNNWPEAFVEGMFLETFINDDERLRFKKYFQSSLVAVLRLEKYAKIIARAILLLKTCTPKNWITEKTFDKTLESLQVAIDSLKGTKQKSVENFREAMEQTKIRILKDQELEE